MTAVPFREQSDITDVAVLKDTAHIDIWYPSYDGRPKYLEVGLMDTRSADGIRISYDFERDGWVIEQDAPTMEPSGENSFEMVEHWTEVYFARARALTPPAFEEFLSGARSAGEAT